MLAAWGTPIVLDTSRGPTYADGFVVVQASEGLAVPKHNHKGVSDWLS